MIVLLLLLGLADAQAAATASSRHWRLSIDAVECEAADSRVTIATRIRYLGPRGPVEAPLARLVDEAGKPYPPKSLVWMRGTRQQAQWLSAGGIANLQSEDVGEVQFKFEVREAKGGLGLEFGDLRPIALGRAKPPAGTGFCERLLKPAQLRVPPGPSPLGAGTAKSNVRVYRFSYPCAAGGNALRTLEAIYPPYPPRQLLALGRGYLPAAREIDLPMGRTPARSYAYSGPDEFPAIEAAALRMLDADFPEYRNQLVLLPAGGPSQARKYFAFNWGTQKVRSGNELESIGIYELRSCAQKP
jgi:hypothetical protein